VSHVCCIHHVSFPFFPKRFDPVPSLTNAPPQSSLYFFVFCFPLSVSLLFFFFLVVKPLSFTAHSVRTLATPGTDSVQPPFSIFLLIVLSPCSVLFLLFPYIQTPLLCISPLTPQILFSSFFPSCLLCPSIYSLRLTFSRHLPPLFFFVFPSLNFMTFPPPTPNTLHSTLTGNSPCPLTPPLTPPFLFDPPPPGPLLSLICLFLHFTIHSPPPSFFCFSRDTSLKRSPLLEFNVHSPLKILLPAVVSWFPPSYIVDTLMSFTVTCLSFPSCEFFFRLFHFCLWRFVRSNCNVPVLRFNPVCLYCSVTTAVTRTFFSARIFRCFLFALLRCFDSRNPFCHPFCVPL